MGDNLKRKELSLKYYDNLSNVISKTAYIGKSVQLGKGIFIAHNAHVGVMSKIEDFSIINTGASIDHECFLEKASFIAPNATLCGKVMVGENSFIGAGATVIPEIKICKNSTIKLQNSIKHIADGAFSNSNIETLNLEDIDHVIEIDSNPLSEVGFLSKNSIKRITFVDETINHIFSLGSNVCIY